MLLKYVPPERLQIEFLKKWRNADRYGAEDLVWLEAEQSAEHGGWVIDAQFIDQMGSSYLLANGFGRAVADAVTMFWYWRRI